jgi:outer membrane biogenesis lipoprotein LolB
MRRQAFSRFSCSLLVLPVLLLLLSACATAPKPAVIANTAPTTPSTVSPAIAQSVKGRISAVATDGEGKGQPFHGGFELTLDPPEGDTGQLMLLTPIGSTVAILGWTKTSAILRKPQGGVALYPSLATMLQETIGIALTPAMLRSWLMATPIDGTPVDAIGPSNFKQLGWDINYALNEDNKKPRLITLRRAATASLSQAELKLVIDEMSP